MRSPDATSVAAGFADGALTVWTPSSSSSRFVAGSIAQEVDLHHEADGSNGHGQAIASLCWRVTGAGRSAELLVGNESGACERWRLGGDLGGNQLLQPTMTIAAGELFAFAACTETGGVCIAAMDGSVHCLEVSA